MHIQIGIDLVEVAEIEESLALHGDRFLDRVYTPAERDWARRHAGRLAAGFAAKEATMKALRRADDAIPWRSVEVRGDDRAPTIALHGEAARVARAGGVHSLSVSMTRDRKRAAAVVIAEAAR